MKNSLVDPLERPAVTGRGRIFHRTTNGKPAKTWHIAYRVNGVPVRESAHTDNRIKAVEFLKLRIKQANGRHRAGRLPRVSSPKRDRRSSGIYFVQRAEGGPIKIGHSRHIPSRLLNLKVGLPELVCLGVTIGASLWEEQRLHRFFVEHRISGEWFAPAAPLLKWIAVNATKLERAPGGVRMRTIRAGESENP